MCYASVVLWWVNVATKCNATWCDRSWSLLVQFILYAAMHEICDEEMKNIFASPSNASLTCVIKLKWKLWLLVMIVKISNYMLMITWVLDCVGWNQPKQAMATRWTWLIFVVGLGTLYQPVRGQKWHGCVEGCYRCGRECSCDWWHVAMLDKVMMKPDCRKQQSRVLK